MPTTRNRRRKLRLKLRDDVLAGDTDYCGKTSTCFTQPSNSNSNHHQSVGTPVRKVKASSDSTKTSKPKKYWKQLDDLIVSASASNTGRYPGLDSDVDEVRKLIARYEDRGDLSSTNNSYKIGDWVISSRIQGIQHKQKAFEGDRSHPHLCALDDLVSQLTYSGWPKDFQAALQAHYEHDNDWNFSRALFRLKQRQAMWEGDRSHPRLVELDFIAKKLTYPFHRRDVQYCEQLHLQYMDDYVGNNIVSRQMQTLRHRQQHWEGKSSLREVNEVSLQHQQQDVRVALEAHLHHCSVAENGQVVDYPTALHQLQHKQLFLVQGDRSHPRLMALDRVTDKVRGTELEQSSNWLQLVKQIEDTHLRYASDDWIGNAIFEKLLKTLQNIQRQHRGSIISSPSSSEFRRPTSKLPPSSPSLSTQCGTASLTLAPSWSSIEDGICSFDDVNSRCQDDDELLEEGGQECFHTSEQEDNEIVLGSVIQQFDSSLCFDEGSVRIEDALSDIDHINGDENKEANDEDVVTSRSSISRSSETRASF